jgi:hypothetical protein
VISAGIAIIVYLIAFRRFILQQTRFVILLLALGFFAASVATDVILEPWLIMRIGHWEYFLEDGAKLLGIACWCSYLAGTGLMPDSTLRQEELSADDNPGR